MAIGCAIVLIGTALTTGWLGRRAVATCADELAIEKA
jgi:hypothetical protein